MTVDVMVNTYNSHRSLDRCLRSVRENIPVRKLFVIDNYSIDGTVEIAEKHDAIVVQTRLSLAEARRLGFKFVETPLFVNVDSDIVLPSNWFNRIMKYWNNDNIGCVWGIPIHQLPLHKEYQTAMFKFRDPCSYHIPHLPNMVARKDLLEDIKFPKLMKVGAVAGEDYWVMHWIEQQGYVCKTVPIYCEHYTFPALLGIKTFWGGASTRLLHRKKLRHMLKQVALSLPQAAFCGVVSGNARVVPYWLRYRMEELYGYLHWNRYFSLKRKFLTGGFSFFDS